MGENHLSQNSPYSPIIACQTTNTIAEVTTPINLSTNTSNRANTNTNTRANISQGTPRGVQVGIYLPTQSCRKEIRGHLHNEMNLRVRAAHYRSLLRENICPVGAYPCISTNLLSSSRQIDTVVNFQMNQAMDTLKVMSDMYSAEGAQCKAGGNTSIQPVGR